MIQHGRRSCQAGRRATSSPPAIYTAAQVLWVALSGVSVRADHLRAFLGAAIGAAMGAGSMADVGIRAGVAQAAESRRFIAPIAASSSPCPSPSRNSRPRRRAQGPLVALVDVCRNSPPEVDTNGKGKRCAAG